MLYMYFNVQCVSTLLALGLLKQHNEKNLIILTMYSKIIYDLKLKLDFIFTYIQII